MRKYARLVLFLNLIFVGLLSQAQNQRAGADVYAKGGSLHEATLAAGGKFVTIEGNLGGWIGYTSVKALSQNSEAILVIKPDSNYCRLSPDGTSIETTYTATVIESLHGRYKPGDVINVTLPGGRYSWPDGATAQVNTPELKKMVNGGTYVLFAARQRPKEKDNQELGVVGGKAGLFELKSDGTVDPSETGLESSLSRRYRGKDANWFLRVVKRVSKEKEAEEREGKKGTNSEEDGEDDPGRSNEL